MASAGQLHNKVWLSRCARLSCGGLLAFAAAGAALGIDNRVELSYAHQTFNLKDVAPGETIEQNIFGAKGRLRGDAGFDQDRSWPQLAAGLPNNLSALREQSAHDVFLAWLPYKYLSLTTAYADLGDIATHAVEHAGYVALPDSF